MFITASTKLATEPKTRLHFNIILAFTLRSSSWSVPVTLTDIFCIGICIAAQSEPYLVVVYIHQSMWNLECLISVDTCVSAHELCITSLCHCVLTRLLHNVYPSGQWKWETGTVRFWGRLEPRTLCSFETSRNWSIDLFALASSFSCCLLTAFRGLLPALNWGLHVVLQFA